MDLTPFLNKKQRFSESAIWKWQEEAYKTLGPSAWTTGRVPSYLTSSPLAAFHVASLAVAYLRDIHASLDNSHPIWIFDLGAGSGRFAYLFLRFFQKLSQGEPWKIRYVLTDIVEENLKAWQTHPLLQTKKEVLEYAYFHHAHPVDRPLFLEKEQREFCWDELVNPPLLLANYFFDTIAQALYQIQGDRLLEGWITLGGSGELASLQESYCYEPVAWKEVKEPGREILQEYVRQKVDSTFLFPSEALSLLNRFFSWTKGRFFLFACDQGIGFAEEWEKGLAPVLHKHTTFSVPVNYDAIRRFFAKRGGQVRLYSSQNRLFVAGAFVVGEEKSLHVESVWEQTLASFSIYEYWHLVEMQRQENRVPSLATLFAILMLGKADPLNTYLWYEEIRTQLAQGTSEEKRMWASLLREVGEQAFPIGEEKGEFYQNLGVLFFEMGETQEALFWFQEAVKRGGSFSALEKNIAVCKRLLQNSGF